MFECLGSLVEDVALQHTLDLTLHSPSSPNLATVSNIGSSTSCCYSLKPLDCSVAQSQVFSPGQSHILDTLYSPPYLVSFQIQIIRARRKQAELWKINSVPETQGLSVCFEYKRSQFNLQLDGSVVGMVKGFHLRPCSTTANQSRQYRPWEINGLTVICVHILDFYAPPWICDVHTVLSMCKSNRHKDMRERNKAPFNM